MGIYIAIVTLIVLECMAFGRVNKSGKLYKAVFYITILFIAFVVGLRSNNVGHDTQNYYKINTTVCELEFKNLFITAPYNTLEKGYLLTVWLFGHINKNPAVFLLICSLFEFTVIGVWLHNNSSEPFLSLLVFVCMFLTFYLTGLRQSLAMSFLLIAYGFLRKKHYLWFFVFCTVAFFFHRSTIIFFGVFFISRFKSPFIYVFSCIIAYPIIYSLRGTLFMQLTRTFSRYEHYHILNHGDAVNYTLLLAIIVVGAIFLRRYTLTSGYEEHTYTTDYAQYQHYLNMVATALALMPLVGINGNMLRVAMYFSMFVCMLIVDMFRRIDSSAIRGVIKVVSLTILILLFLNSIETSATYKYEFVGWENLFMKVG